MIRVMGRHYQNTETSAQVILRLERDIKELTEALSRSNLQLNAALQVVEQHEQELFDLRNVASGQAATDTRRIDFLEANPSSVIPVWEKKRPAPPAYYAVSCCARREDSLRAGVDVAMEY